MNMEGVGLYAGFYKLATNYTISYSIYPNSTVSCDKP